MKKLGKNGYPSRVGSLAKAKGAAVLLLEAVSLLEVVFPVFSLAHDPTAHQGNLEEAGGQPVLWRARMTSPVASHRYWPAPAKES